MSTPYEIPLTSKAQNFLIDLASTTYSIYLFWNVAVSCWMINLNDASGNPIIQGIPLVTGADLLAQYSYMNLGGALIVQTDFATDDIPTLSNLGAESHLYFVVK